MGNHTGKPMGIMPATYTLIHGVLVPATLVCSQKQHIKFNQELRELWLISKKITKLLLQRFSHVCGIMFDRILYLWLCLLPWHFPWQSFCEKPQRIYMSTRIPWHSCPILPSDSMATTPSCPSSKNTTTPNSTFTVATVAVALTLFLPATQGKTSTSKPAKAKLKTEMKNKQFSYKFDNTKDNYISFLNSILAAHRLATKYGPVTSSSQFPIKIITPPAQA